ncbi:hypothetical protein ACFC0M_14935 [Streptomyces sp. NPDC056149]|uniref:hypothetical protein n=1 Tax=Streptomyces sp. NPDC056149 TaxID=3345728 RepID=UPI0035D55324
MSTSSPYPPHSYGPPTAPSRRWWQHPALIIALLIFIPPAGIALAWMSPWKQKTKVIASALALLWFLFVLFQDPPKKEAAAGPKPTATVTAAPTSSAATAEPTPPPSEAPMPGVVTKTYAEASSAIGKLIDGDIRVYSAYTDVELPKDHDDWVVCFQGPTANSTLVRKDANPRLHLVAPGTACPTSKGTELHPEPTHEPAPDNGSTGGSGTGGSGSSDDSSSSSGSSSSGGGVGVVHPGSFCGTPGATGVTKKGTPMICGPGSDGRNRWHS